MTLNATRGQVAFLLIILGIGVAAVGYFLGFKTFNDKTVAIKAENETKTERLNNLKILNRELQFFNDETARMRGEIDDVYSKFPSDTREEDAILLAINQEIIAPQFVTEVQIGELTDVDYSEIAAIYNDDNTSLEEDVQAVIDGEATVYSDAEGANMADPSKDGLIPLKYRSSVIQGRMSYEALKNSVRNILNQPNRITIGGLSYDYDEDTGLIEGSTNVFFFCIPSLDKPYVEPNLSAVLLGTDNIFKTSELTNFYENIVPAVNAMQGEQTDGERETE